MLSTKNSSWAASWLVGSAIVVSATSLSALDAYTPEYQSPAGGYSLGGDSRENSPAQSSVYDGESAYRPDGSYIQPWVDGNAGEGSQGYGRDSLGSQDGVQPANERNKGIAVGVEEPDHDSGYSPEDTSVRPAGVTTPEDFASPSHGPDSVSINVPNIPWYPADWAVPSNAPFNNSPINAPLNGLPMNAEWNAPSHNAPMNAGPNVHPTYPDTWRYPPLTVTEPVGLQKVGEEDVPHGAAPEPPPPPHGSQPPAVPEPSGLAGIVGGVVSFFKSLWPF